MSYKQGSLRFQAPADPDTWSGVRDAIDFNNECLQQLAPQFTYKNGVRPPTHSEDCLYLNVYSPTKKDTQGPLPVMVWVHGGGYVLGSGSVYDGTTLATKGVILVTINYRLDVFGFMSTEDDVMPGNYGMLDQVAALRWVKNNIAAFGGDPNRITIFGESAGSASVSLLILSPLTKGLFQRGIMESGNSLSGFSVHYSGNSIAPRMGARLVSIGAQCNTLDNTTTLLSCLQQIDAGMLLNISMTVSSALNVGNIWTPRVETTYGFLPDSPSSILLSGQFNQVDTIRGFNTDESGLFVNVVNITHDVALQNIPRYYLLQFTQLVRDDLSKLMVSEYISDTTDPDILGQEILDMGDDLSFVGPTITELNYFVPRSNKRRHYLYEFNYRPSFSKMPKWMSAVHGDEIPFVFGVQEKEFVDFPLYGPPDIVDISVSEQMMEMWTNFAKTGNPSSARTTWSLYSPAGPNYLRINAKPELKAWPRPKVINFFRKILHELDGTPLSPADTVIGSLRFQPPADPDSWSGVRDAINFNNKCLQKLRDRPTIKNGDRHSEDCLYLNVYSPTKKDTQGPLPVMVYIHGGGYYLGAGSTYDGTTLATKGVILVTMNYRLDIFGFMSTEDDVMPGNYGMLDQVAALRWVKNNIAAFGGDPNRVTIFGQSAGSSSVSLLILSPLAKGLFQRGIMESGASLSPWAVNFPGNSIAPRMAARLVSVGAQCNTLDNTTKLLSCLQQTDADMLLNISLAVNEALGAGLIWNPRVETTYRFLPDKPSSILSRGQFNKVDTIRGFNTDEMGYNSRSVDPNVGIKRDVAQRYLTQFTQLAQDALSQIFVPEYISNTTDPDILEIVNMGDDLLFIGPTIAEINYVVPRSNGGRHYLYEFNHRPSFSKYPKWISAIHGQEIPFVFGIQSKEFIYSQFYGTPNTEDTSISEQMMEMWTNFAKTGNPSSSQTTWSLYSPVTPNYLLINAKSESKLWSRHQAAATFSKVFQKLDGTSLLTADTIVG